MVNLTAHFTDPTLAPTPASSTHVVERRPRQIAHCEIVVTSPADEDRFADDLLPWADPYIASLMAGLQREGAAV